MNKILVTGCAGFIGSNLCEKLLQRNYTVIGIDNFDEYYSKRHKLFNMKNFINHQNFSFSELDIKYDDDLKKISDKGIDLVIHLAAKAGIRPSIANPTEYIQTNVLGTQNILEMMRRKKIRKMIFASSSSVYGNNKKIPFSETDNIDFPISPYAATKKACELLNHTYHHLFDFDILNLRFFTVYGPGQRPDLVIHKFVDRIVRSEKIEIYGDGTSSRDYVYIDDLIDGINSAVDLVMNNSNIYEIVNLGNNYPVVLNDLLSALSELLSLKPKVFYSGSQEGDMEHTFADISKAEKILNYHPKTKLHQGLENFINWYNDFNKK